MTLAGQKALVTGASRGIGRAIAEALVAEGIQVFGTSRNPELVEWPVGVTPVRLDLSSAAAVQSDWDAALLGDQHFDIVVNNAGAGAFGAFRDGCFELWEEQVGLMLLGAMKVSHLALRQWSAEEPGVLVNVSSLAVEYPIPYMSGYNAAKAGLAAFCESLLLECDPQVVRVLELRLGDVNTDFNDNVVGEAIGARQSKVWAAMCKHVASGPNPERVARELLKSLRNDRDGIVRVGGFFQTVVASVFGRLVSHRVKRAVNISYYNVDGDR